MRYLFPVIVFALLSAGSFGNAADRVPPFSLPGTDESTVALSTDADVRFHVLCFLGTECPLAKLYGPRLQRLSVRYHDDGVRFIGINSNVQDSLEQWAQFGRTAGLTFPLAKDFDRSVAQSAGATRTPEVIVIDRAGLIRYRGRIDDQYQPGIARSAPSKQDLRDAIEQLIAGETVAVSATEAVGCLIAMPGREIDAECEVTYCKDVSRVLRRHCVECHRDGEIGPFALTDYNEIVGWSEMMLEVIDQKRMPPWHASDDHAKIANARKMSDRDKELLAEWVAGGMPYGQASDLPEPIAYTTGWRLEREPDAVFSVSKQPFQVPAEGTVEYQYFIVDPKFTEDKWVTSTQIVPGNRSVVHHVIAFIRPPDGQSIQSYGMLGAYVPGQIVSPLPDGYARRVPAGSRIVFQMHYTPTGAQTEDRSRIGLLFADESDVTHEVFAMGAIEQDFEIPPGDASHEVNGVLSGFPKDARLLSIMPHMHLRGKSFRMSQQVDGEATTLLEVPTYDFNWQHNYELAQPLPLDGVDRLKFTAVFDNSAGNPTNPAPTEYVTWGDQTWQEMAVVFAAVAKPRVKDPRVKNSPGKTTPSAKESSEQQAIEDRLAARREAGMKQAKKFADDYMQRFDKNGDGYIAKHELPDSVRMNLFSSLDNNRDEVVSRDEIISQVIWRF
ncbi:redoxin domain-containing protein [Stieleria marina]|uniref:Thiol-disulfide oxidoreductase n=1 Tax=Stieleria marina TaxID=1930275 RepID=A0A517NVW0_9BACT|nr:thiol-disulfide oxidoreductase [Planctomycetes bacterium K23_9]